VLATLAVSVVAFASTNVDDVSVLLGFFADPAFRARHVVLGQYLGIGALVAVSLVCSLIAWWSRLPISVFSDCSPSPSG
jgi:cadmium resistance protein CadD (predicted permease)